MLYYSKDIESFGTGLKRIAEACDASGVRYEFKKMKSGFVVCFYRADIKADKNTDKIGISTEKVRISTDNMNLSQKKILKYLLENDKITNKEVQKLLGVKESRALKIMKEMVEAGVLSKQGKLKGSYYILKQ